MLHRLPSNRKCLSIKQPIRYISSVLTRVLTGVGSREQYWRLKTAEIRMDLLWICHLNMHFYSHPRCPRGKIDSAIIARWESKRPRPVPWCGHLFSLVVCQSKDVDALTSVFISINHWKHFVLTFMKTPERVIPLLVSLPIPFKPPSKTPRDPS